MNGFDDKTNAFHLITLTFHLLHLIISLNCVNGFPYILLKCNSYFPYILLKCNSCFPYILLKCNSCFPLYTNSSVILTCFSCAASARLGSSLSIFDLIRLFSSSLGEHPVEFSILQKIFSFTSQCRLHYH